MQIIYDENAFTGIASVLALGMFDGVHAAHQALIRRAVELARESDAESVVCTFDRHPLSLLRPESAPRMLLTLDQRIEKIRALGADWVLVKPFTQDLAQRPAAEFLKAWTQTLHARAVVAGFNYTFGRNAEGNADTIRAVAEESGFRAEILPPVTDCGDRVSSTLIRELQDQGQDARARRLMESDL